MKKLLTVMLFAAGLFSSTYAMGQIYNGKAGELKEPFDRAVNMHNAMWADVPGAGDEESKMSQEKRYVQMTNDMNQANKTHFNDVTSYTGINGFNDE